MLVFCSVLTVTILLHSLYKYCTIKLTTTKIYTLNFSIQSKLLFINKSVHHSLLTQTNSKYIEYY